MLVGFSNSGRTHAYPVINFRPSIRRLLSANRFSPSSACFMLSIVALASSTRTRGPDLCRQSLARNPDLLKCDIFIEPAMGSFSLKCPYPPQKRPHTPESPIYPVCRCRCNPSNATSPVPNSQTAPGSGTAETSPGLTGHAMYWTTLASKSWRPPMILKYHASSGTGTYSVLNQYVFLRF
jgi:hypothetical protein